jgi:N-acetylglucosaminyl-diphospho-decaprenol L-rhamnosyltransferase
VSDTQRPGDPAADRARWAAVVVNYESGDLLEACVRSIQADTSAGKPELVVVDNGSSDGSTDALRDDAAVTVVDPGRNLGYPGAANLGIARTTAAVVAVCNADLRVSPGAAGVMVRRLDAEPDLGAVGPLVREPDGKIYPSARRVPSTGDAVGHGLVGLVKPDNPYTRRYRELDADPLQPRDVDWVSGAAIWLRRRALESVDGWDDGYFMYVEDVDLCWRLRGAGWRVGYEPAAEVVHVQGASTAHHPYTMIAAHHRSLLRFAAKRWHGWRRVLLVPAAAYLGVRAGLAMAVHAVRPRSGTAKGTR